MKRLGINIDHVATLRNARHAIHPSPLVAAKLAIKYGADSITIHLREDRRHITDKDLFKIVRLKNIRVNLEMAPTNKMLKIALKSKPSFVCIVPEKREELTTEGGLNLDKDNFRIKKIIHYLKKKGIRTSLFIEPRIQDIRKAKKLCADCVELHTGKFCNLYNLNKKFFTHLIGSVKKTEEQLKQDYKLIDFINIEGNAGFGFIEDTSCFHRVLAPKNEPRLALQFRYH